jgi:hypothetical protein
MKAQELKINNLVYSVLNDFIEKSVMDIIVVNIDILKDLVRYENKTCKKIKYPYISIEPIPLTELKEQSEFFGDNDEFTLRLNHYDYPNIVTEVSLEQFGEGRCSLPHIKYVHQYQNLYYDLTGKELEVEL